MLVGVTISVFAIMGVAPGGPEAVLGGGEFPPETAARVRQRLGLDRPLVAQYAGWAGAALRGDLGRSFKTNDPVATLIVDRLGPTLQLTAGAGLFVSHIVFPVEMLLWACSGSVDYSLRATLCDLSSVCCHESSS